MRKLYTEPSIHASYQISIDLAILEMNRMHCTRSYNEHSSHVCFQTKKKVSNGLREKDFKRHFSVKSYVKLCTAMACNGRHLEFFRPPTK
jgi:hypothetical protein